MQEWCNSHRRLPSGHGVVGTGPFTDSHATLCAYSGRRLRVGFPEAFMIAYVRGGSSIDTTLNPFLSAAMTRVPLSYMVEELPTMIGDGSSALACSRHGRTFVYTNQTLPTDRPGSITIWHLWLS